MAKKKRTSNNKLREWQDSLHTNEIEFEDTKIDIEARDELFAGSRDITNICTDGGTGLPSEAQHVRNIIDELIESQVNSNIPQPKVVPIYAKDEKKAKLIEDMIRNELNRLPFEKINDLQERLVPLQGSSYYWVDWDAMSGGNYNGDISVQVIHPKNLIPQHGVITCLEDMDYFFIKVPQTKDYISTRYNVDVYDLTEDEPDTRKEEDVAADDMVTQIIAYYRNGKGGIGRYSWVCDTELESLDDYQSRRLTRCENCGEVIIEDIEAPKTSSLMGKENEAVTALTGTSCPSCGHKKFKQTQEKYEYLSGDLQTENLLVPELVDAEVPLYTEDGEPMLDELGNQVIETEKEPNRIPYYKTNMYPVVEQKNVSAIQQLMGASDADKIADQQNTINILSSKINDKLMKATSYIMMPPETRIKTDGSDSNYIYPESLAAYNQIKAINCQPSIEKDLTWLMSVYEESRQIIGITDSYQGRSDSTATSGVAKQFSAAQAAGRMESKKVNRDVAYATLFELMFKLKLAYADEPRSVVGETIDGKRDFKEFNRYDFLEDGPNGYYWNDNFLFSTDNSAPLASNREAMWQETRMNLETGAYGDPTKFSTLILFWTKMELLHYPGAAQTKEYLEAELVKQQQEQAMMMQMQLQMQQQGGQNASEDQLQTQEPLR